MTHWCKDKSELKQGTLPGEQHNCLLGGGSRQAGGWEWAGAGEEVGRCQQVSVVGTGDRVQPSHSGCVCSEGRERLEPTKWTTPHQFLESSLGKRQL